MTLLSRARLLSSVTEPTVLVGRSYSGAVISGTATETPQVKALVYITAFGLDEGESLESLAKQGPPSPGSTAIEPDANGYLWINRDKFHDAFAGGATDDEASIMAAVQKPLVLASFSGTWVKSPSARGCCRLYPATSVFLRNHPHQTCWFFSLLRTAEPHAAVASSV